MMASFKLSTVPTATATTPNKIKIYFHRFEAHTKHIHRFKVSCNATPEDNNDRTLETSLHMQNIDRRNMILGLGGLFVAGNLTSLSLASTDSVPATSNHSDCPAASLGIKNLGHDVKELMANSEEGVDTNKLRYDYQRSEIVKKVEDVEFPVKLDETVKVLVKRPAVNRTKEDKDKATEILLVNGVPEFF
ncbi:hypothetical protein L1887_39638 [Cichorium endivia]|nr:hypothetical protein L1887_39638 [Cichorium endivia]